MTLHPSLYDVFNAVKIFSATPISLDLLLFAAYLSHFRCRARRYSAIDLFGLVL